MKKETPFEPIDFLFFAQVLAALVPIATKALEERKKFREKQRNTVFYTNIGKVTI